MMQILLATRDSLRAYYVEMPNTISLSLEVRKVCKNKTDELWDFYLVQFVRCAEKDFKAEEKEHVPVFDRDI